MWEQLRSEVRHRWRALVHRDQAEAELDGELQFHLEQEARKLEGRGMTPANARRAARVAFGGVERIKEDAREARGLSLIDQGWSDLRYVLRTLRARPAFTVGVACTLALGIGANAAMFGIVDRLMFRAPAALRSPERVYRVHLNWTEDGDLQRDRSMAFPRFRDFARESRTAEVVGAFQVRTVALDRGDATHEARAAVISASFRELFDAEPVLGRWFTAAEDDPPGSGAVVVLSYDYWVSRLGARPDVIGQQLQVDRLDATIVGVAPAGFAGIADAGDPAVFLPMSAFAYSMRGASYATSYNWGWLQLAVRLRPGISAAEAAADFTNAYRLSWRAEAATGRTLSAEQAQPFVVLGPAQLGRGPDAPLDTRVAFWLSGVAVIVLLIACANITNLLLSRSVSRRREFAMRLALGVGRGRLVRQLLIEGLVLGALGALGGVLLARFGGVTLRALLLPDAAHAAVLTDTRTLGFVSLLAMVAGALTALVPAIFASQLDVGEALKAGGRGATYRRSRLQGALVATQAALSVLLLAGAALFVRSLQHAQERRLGYDVAPVLYAEVNRRGTTISDSAAAVLTTSLLEAARSLAGVTHVTTATSVPFWSMESRGLAVEGVDTLQRLGRFTLQAGSAEYFQATGTRILRGRAFSDEDRAGAPPVAVVSDAMARVVWPGRDAIGECIRVDSREGPCRTVIGIAEEPVMEDFAETREYTYFLPVAQFPEGNALQFFVRVQGDPFATVQTLRSRLQALLPAAAYATVVPLEQLIAPQLRGWRFGATMFVVFGAIALVLAALGLHNLLAYELALREKDIGVRLALGASRARLMRLVVGQGTSLVALGLGIGLLLAYLLAPPLEALMFEQSPRDPAVFVSIGALLLVVAGLASAIPAWRATRLDPGVTLRLE